MVPTDGSRIGGADSHLRALKKAIALTGNTYSVACHEDIPGKLRMAFEVISRRFARERWLVLTSLLEITHGVFAARSILRERADLINVHYPACFPAASWIAKLTNVPVLLTVHSTFAEGLAEGGQFPRASAGNRLAHFLEAYSYRNANLVVTVSSYLRGYVHRRVGEGSGQVTVQKNCVDTNEFRPRSRGEAIQALKSLGDATGAMDKRRRIVLSACRLIAVKGVRYLVEAASIIKSEGGDDVHFVIAGEGRELPELLDLQSKLGLKESVSFVGAIPHRLMKYVYNHADVFVVPSISSGQVQEGLPISALEAMASGVPVICTNTGGLVEIVRNGETGYMIPEKSAEALARQIRMTLEQDQSRVTAQARAYVEENHSIEANARSLGRLLADAVSISS